jgi:hypothetical protein
MNTKKNESDESEATPRGDKSESESEDGRKERVAVASEGEQLLDVSEETEHQRESCPDGVECRSEDPRHFILFLHTARDEFSVPSSTPPASFGNRSFLFTSINSAEGFDSGGVDNRNDDSGDPAALDALTDKRAMLRRSVSCDSGLKRELSLPNLGGLALGSGGGGSTNRSDEKSGWLHKRAALRKVHSLSSLSCPPPHVLMDGNTNSYAWRAVHALGTELDVLVVCAATTDEAVVVL